MTALELSVPVCIFVQGTFQEIRGIKNKSIVNLLDGIFTDHEFQRRLKINDHFSSPAHANKKIVKCRFKKNWQIKHG